MERKSFGLATDTVAKGVVQEAVEWINRSKKRKGSSKTPYTYFCKSPYRKLSQKKSTKFSMSVFPRPFLVLSRFRVFLSDGSSKTQQLWFAKNRVEKFLQKMRQKNLKPMLCRFFITTFFGVSRC
jgi:hypothetical protein